MKKNIIRVLSVVLALVLLFGALPFTVSAVRCKHDHGTHWELLGTYKHCEVCDTCGARLRTGDHDIYDNSQWYFSYINADHGPYGTHAQICKKCGYTHWEEHRYTRSTVTINGKAHGGVLVCTAPKCKHIFYGENPQG